MSFIQEKRVDLGQLISGTFAALARLKRELAIYFAVFAMLAIVGQVDTVFGCVIAFISFFGYFLGQYLLYQAILQKTGLLQDARKRVFGFAIMAFLLGLPIMIGFNFFVVPGLILGAKWIMAPTYLVARDRNVFEAIGDSWRASEFNTVQLSIAYLVFWIIWIVSFMILGGIGEAIMPRGLDAMSPLGWLGVHFLPVLMMGLSISAYQQLSDDTSRLSEVFT